MAYDTGNGATVAFTSGTFAGAVIDIDIGGRTLEALDASVLATTTNMAKAPSDLIDNEPWTVNYFVDPTDSDMWAPAIGTVDTLTITFPSQLAGDDATYAATGFVTNQKPPTVANGTLMQGSFEFTPDGTTGPTFTGEAES